MDATALSSSNPAGVARLLEHCAALDPDRRRPPARTRLEALLGSELTRRLVLALCSR